MTPSLSEGGAQRTRVAIFVHSCILLIRNLAPRPEVYSVYTQSYTEQAVARAHVTTEDETANAAFDSHDARYEAARTCTLTFSIPFPMRCNLRACERNYTTLTTRPHTRRAQNL